MATTSIDITQEVAAFKSATYGEDVRNAMVSVGTKLKNQIDSYTDSINEIITEYGKVENTVSVLTAGITRINSNGKANIQWVSGGYKTDGGWTNYDSIDGDVDGIHPIPIQFKSGDVIPCPSGYTMDPILQFEVSNQTIIRKDFFYLQKEPK